MCILISVLAVFNPRKPPQQIKVCADAELPVCPPGGAVQAIKGAARPQGRVGRNRQDEHGKARKESQRAGGAAGERGPRSRDGRVALRGPAGSGSAQGSRRGTCLGPSAGVPPARPPPRASHSQHGCAPFGRTGPAGGAPSQLPAGPQRGPLTPAAGESQASAPCPLRPRVRRAEWTGQLGR